MIYQYFNINIVAITNFIIQALLIIGAIVGFILIGFAYIKINSLKYKEQEKERKRKQALKKKRTIKRGKSKGVKRR